jgi:hypothetical protein
LIHRRKRVVESTSPVLPGAFLAGLFMAMDLKFNKVFKRVVNMNGARDELVYPLTNQ